MFGESHAIAVITSLSHLAGRELVAIGREKKTKDRDADANPFHIFPEKKLFPEISISYVFKETCFCATCSKNSAYI